MAEHLLMTCDLCALCLTTCTAVSRRKHKFKSVKLEPEFDFEGGMVTL